MRFTLVFLFGAALVAGAILLLALWDETAPSLAGPRVIYEQAAVRWVE